MHPIQRKLVCTPGMAASSFDQAFSRSCSLVHRCIDKHHDACCPAWRLCHAGALNAWTAACARPSDSTKATKTLAGTHYTVSAVHIGNAKLITDTRSFFRCPCRSTAAAMLVLYGAAPSQRLCVSVAMPGSGHRRTCRGAAGRDALPARSLLRSCTNSSDEWQL